MMGRYNILMVMMLLALNWSASAEMPVPVLSGVSLLEIGAGGNTCGKSVCPASLPGGGVCCGDGVHRCSQ